MQVWPVVLVWFSNILVMSLVLATFEILLEKNNGWGSGLNSNGWGKRVFEGSAIARISEKPYFTVYHIFMFLLVVPTCLIVEYLAVKSLGIAHVAHSRVLGNSNLCLVMQIGNVRIVPLFYLVSVWFALVFVEDFLWFIMNWYYPNSLQELLSGKIWWHKRWISLGPIKLPRFYLSSLVLSIAFLGGSLCV